MLDGFSMQLHDQNAIISILEDSRLSFIPKGNKVQAKYKGLYLSYTPQTYRLWIRGSFHKFYNDNKHNANDFTFDDYLLVLKELYNDLSIDPSTTTIHSIEIGVNINLPYAPEILINSILMYKNKFPINENHGIRFKFKQYEIKLYSKSSQCSSLKLDNNIRFEVKFRKMLKFRKDIGFVRTLDDFLNKDLWLKAGYYLISILDKLLVVNLFDKNIDIKSMSSNEYKSFLLLTNPNQLRLLKGSSLSRAKSKLKRLLKKYSRIDIIEDFRILLLKKIVLRLLSIKKQDLHCFNHIDEEVNQFFFLENMKSIIENPCYYISDTC